MPGPDNEWLAAKLEEVAELLDAQAANPFRRLVGRRRGCGRGRVALEAPGQGLAHGAHARRPYGLEGEDGP